MAMAVTQQRVRKCDALIARIVRERDKSREIQEVAAEHGQVLEQQLNEVLELRAKFARLSE